MVFLISSDIGSSIFRTMQKLKLGYVIPETRGGGGAKCWLGLVLGFLLINRFLEL